MGVKAGLRPFLPRFQGYKMSNILYNFKISLLKIFVFLLENILIFSFLIFIKIFNGYILEIPGVPSQQFIWVVIKGVKVKKK